MPTKTNPDFIDFETIFAAVNVARQQRGEQPLLPSEFPIKVEAITRETTYDKLLCMPSDEELSPWRSFEVTGFTLTMLDGSTKMLFKHSPNSIWPLTDEDAEVVRKLCSGCAP